MKTLLNVLISLCIAAVHSDMAGVSVTIGDCLCVSGLGVGATDQPGASVGVVVATYNSGTCFKATGNTVTVSGYTWYELDTNPQPSWVSGGSLTKVWKTRCDSGPCGSEQKSLACELLYSRNVWAAREHAYGEKDGADAYSNLKDLCYKGKAKRSSFQCSECPEPAPGGTTCLGLSLLRYLIILKDKGPIKINELAGACHICGSRHYAGLAVDLVDGPRNVEFKLTCNVMGGLAIEEPGQIHCQFNK